MLNDIYGTFVTLVLAAVLSQFCSGCSRLPLTTTSPAGTYKVEFTKGKNDLHVDLVKFSVWRGEQPIIVDEPTGEQEGSFDTPFTIKYPDQVWLSDAALRIGIKEHFGQHQGVIHITNDSRRVLTYVRLHTDDQYLVFDLEPGCSIELPAYWSRVNGVHSNELTIFAKFNNSKKLVQQDASFGIKNVGEGLAHFWVSISDAGVRWSR